MLGKSVSRPHIVQPIEKVINRLYLQLNSFYHANYDKEINPCKVLSCTRTPTEYCTPMPREKAMRPAGCIAYINETNTVIQKVLV